LWDAGHAPLPVVVLGTNLANVISVTKNVSTQRIEVLVDGVNPDPANPTGYDPSDVAFIRIRGLRGNDLITVDPAVEVPTEIHGDGGNDTITGGSGPDTLDGGVGNDSLAGGAGDDSIFDRSGNDTLLGNADDDTLSGGRGNDSLQGGPGADLLLGLSGFDTLHGGDGDDVLLGGAHNDQLFGDAGSDLLFGETGHDTLSGGDDDDGLAGGPGNDQLNGDGGDDILSSASGRDTVSGGAGADIFGPTGRLGQRTDIDENEDVDIDVQVSTGSYTDPSLLGTRTDLSPGSPDISDATHVIGPVDYSAFGTGNPPSYGRHHSRFLRGGDHGAPVRPTGVYTSVLDDADVVHNLEHGHVWVSYNPTLIGAADLRMLRFVVSAFGSGHGIILSPRPANGAAIALVSWGHLLTLSNLNVGSVVDFILTNRGHAPEGFITP
jgi:hypothetical protein